MNARGCGVAGQSPSVQMNGRGVAQSSRAPVSGTGGRGSKARLPDHHPWQERLRAKVVVDLAGCWVWQGAKDPAGYGAVKLNGRKWNAHRAAYVAFVGQVPNARIVCHRCHNHACINPDHLYAGSRSDNISDAKRAGKDMAARLTPEQVAQIRRNRQPRSALANRFGVGLSTINKILRGDTHRPEGPREQRRPRKLTTEQVIYIRGSKKRNVDLARELSVVPSTISEIRSCKWRKHG